MCLAPTNPASREWGIFHNWNTTPKKTFTCGSTHFAKWLDIEKGLFSRSQNRCTYIHEEEIGQLSQSQATKGLRCHQRLNLHRNCQRSSFASGTLWLSISSSVQRSTASMASSRAVPQGTQCHSLDGKLLLHELFWPFYLCPKMFVAGSQ